MCYSRPRWHSSRLVGHTFIFYCHMLFGLEVSVIIAHIAHALCKRGCRLIRYRHTVNKRVVTIEACYNCPRSPLCQVVFVYAPLLVITESLFGRLLLRVPERETSNLGDFSHVIHSLCSCLRAVRPSRPHVR